MDFKELIKINKKLLIKIKELKEKLIKERDKYASSR